MGFEEEKNLKNQKSYRYQHKTVGYFATCSGGKDLGDAIILIGHFLVQQLFYSQLIKRHLADAAAAAMGVM